MSALLYIALALIVIWWLFKRIFSESKYLSNVPTPSKAHPLLGHIPLMDPQKPHHQLSQWAKEYGGLYKIRISGSTVLVANSYELIHQMLVTAGDDFSNRPSSFRTAALTGNNSEFCFNNRTPKMKHMKKMFVSHTKSYGTGSDKIESIVTKGITDCIDNLVKMDGHPVDLKEKLMEVLAGIVCCMAIGYYPEPQDLKAILDFVTGQVRVLAVGGNGELLDKFPWLRFLGNNLWKDIQAITDLQESQYNKWKQQTEKDETKSGYLTHILELLSGENKYGYTEDNAQHTMWVMFAGGVGTSTSTMTSLFNMLVHRQDIQDKLREESSTVLKGRLPQLRDKHDLHYHMATIYEAVRYFTVVPLAIPHLTVRTTKLGNTTVPPNTPVWPNLWHLHHDEDVWQDPYTFCPERYLDDDGHLVHADHPSRKNNFGFSAGPRVCPGELFAMSRMMLMLASLVQRFDICPATTLDEQISCDCRELLLGLTLAPPPIHIRFVPRKS